MLRLRARRSWVTGRKEGCEASLLGLVTPTEQLPTVILVPVVPPDIDTTRGRQLLGPPWWPDG